ncbi:MAG: NUDIX hydrolase [Chloroflexi bacterium]|nr:NUDIX hydrolase [Chloroflexota bacterium]
MKDYIVNYGEEVNLEKLKEEGSQSEWDQFPESHKNLPIVCHDVFIEYNGGILLVVRDNEPAKGKKWCIGGRMKRGIPTEESLKMKAKEECGLELKDLQYLGCGRVYWNSDPFGHGKGADTPTFVYFAKGEGDKGGEGSCDPYGSRILDRAISP